MRVKVLQIVWHNKEPVFSLDFHPSGLLATGGADGEIKLWKLSTDGGEALGAAFLESVTGANYETGMKTWNCVRFCPTGKSLAAAGDMGQIFVFRPSEGGGEGLGGAGWKGTNCGAYSGEDVVDLCWAADGSGFVTAANDMTCMFWDPEAKAARARLRLEGHRLYVQGVAWDPHGQFVVSQGADRACRVYSLRQAVPGVKRKAAGSRRAIDRLEGLYCSHVIAKSVPRGSSGGAAAEGLADKQAGAKRPGGQHLFHDESLNTFFRRLAWSPDGSLLVVPAGLRQAAERGGGGQQQQGSVAHVFARGCWQAPLLQLPVSPKPAVAVRFCPLLFELEPGSSDGRLPIELPYRMVFAVATKDSVALYDTQSAQPLALLAGLHLELVTDLAWAPDGRTLAISSYDSYCSLACFEEGELGKPLRPEAVPPHISSCLWGSVAAAAGQPPLTPSAAAGPQAGGDADRQAGPAALPGILLAPAAPAAAAAAGGAGKGPAGFKRARRIAPVPVQPTPAQATPAQLTPAEATVEPAAEAPAPAQQPGEQAAPAGGFGQSIAAAAAAAGRAAAQQ